MNPRRRYERPDGTCCRCDKADCAVLPLVRRLRAEGWEHTRTNRAQQPPQGSMLAHAGIATRLEPTLCMRGPGQVQSAANQVWAPRWAVPALKCLHEAQRVDRGHAGDAKAWAVARLAWLGRNPQAQAGFMTVLGLGGWHDLPGGRDPVDDTTARLRAGRWLCASYLEDKQT